MFNDIWDMTRVAREFHASINTVQSAWRYSTTTTVAVHINAHCATLTAQQAKRVRADIGPVRYLTAGRWQDLTERLRIAPLTLPRTALPLPDVVLGNRPGWEAATLRAWAEETDRIDSHGRLKLASPPGRPPGIRETRPRRTAEAAA